MIENETRMSTALRALRDVTGPVTSENEHRMQDYVDAIETELDRIKSERGLR